MKDKQFKIGPIISETCSTIPFFTLTHVTNVFDYE